MTSQAQENSRNVFQLCFIESGIFLKQKFDLDPDMWGQSLDDLISLDFNEFQVGTTLTKESIPLITNSIYEELVLNQQKKKNLRINKSDVILFVYTLCKIDDIILFPVYQIRTKEVFQSKREWEKEFTLLPDECCNNNFFKEIDQDSIYSKGYLTTEEIKTEFEKLRSLLAEKLSPEEPKQTPVLNQKKSFDLPIDTEKSVLGETKCQYKENHVECQSLIHVHFLNKDEPKAMQTFKESSFNVPINSRLTFGSIPETLRFCYGGSRTRSCKSFYDRLIFEKSEDGQIMEQNFQNFLSDSLQSCLLFQEMIQKRPQSETQEHRLLFVSVYI